MLGGEAGKALAAFERALELDAGLVEARFNRGVALLRIGDLRAAAAAFAALSGAGEETGTSQTSLRAGAAYHQALALDRLGDRDGAARSLDRALTIDPSFAPAMLYAGLLRERRGQLDAAVRSYLAYLKIHPDSTAALLRVGITAQRAGRTDVAITYLRRVIEKSPDSPEAVEARKFLVMWE
ncbi:MAG TPA: tetratricopeptide repeat protein [Thermoanaerobaculia bacterium]|nr:tetratricopeptide repeat protein [Thermoanaerobaculia bacterium]